MTSDCISTFTFLCAKSLLLSHRKNIFNYHFDEVVPRESRRYTKIYLTIEHSISKALTIEHFTIFGTFFLIIMTTEEKTNL